MTGTNNRQPDRPTDITIKSIRAFRQLSFLFCAILLASVCRCVRWHTQHFCGCVCETIYLEHYTDAFFPLNIHPSIHSKFQLRLCSMIGSSEHHASNSIHIIESIQWPTHLYPTWRVNIQEFGQQKPLHVAVSFVMFWRCGVPVLKYLNYVWANEECFKVFNIF